MLIVSANVTYKSLGDELRGNVANNFTIFSWTIGLSMDIGIFERKYTFVFCKNASYDDF